MYVRLKLGCKQNTLFWINFVVRLFNPSCRCLYSVHILLSLNAIPTVYFPFELFDGINYSVNNLGGQLVL